jgi:toxin ParE1/3/4
VRLVWSGTSLRHLREARDFIALDNPDAAEGLVAAIRAAADRLLTFPHLGIRMAPHRRRMVVAGTAFHLVYRVDRDEIVILAVWHGARQWPLSAP